MADMPKRPPSSPAGPMVVEVLVFPAVQALDVTGPLQVFASANDHALAAGRKPPYVFHVVAKEGLGVLSSSGLGLTASPLSRADEPVDTLLVAGGQGVSAAARDPALLAWVRLRAATARRLSSVCTGAFLLAAAGLLDGRRAATHWSVCDELARRHPQVRVEADPIFIRDGDLWTSAGVTAGIDLALAMVEDDLGRVAALAVARYMVVFLKRPGGQAQFSTLLSMQTDDDRFSELHDWIYAHLAQDLALPRLAEQAGMSERSFSRKRPGNTA